MSEYAMMCREMMRQGKIPPKNWQRRVSAKEKTKIYDAWVAWYLDLVIDRKPLPGRGTSSCIRALTKRQKQKIFNARGFDTDKVEREKRKERIAAEKKAWLDSHGGQHTQDVMARAQIAREERKNYLRHKSFLKTWRKAIRLGFCGWNGYRFTFPAWNYDRWCGGRYGEAMREKRDKHWFDKVREDIVCEAVRYHSRCESLRKIEKVYGDDDGFVRIFKRVGIDNLDNFILQRMPEDYSSKTFRELSEHLLGRDLVEVMACRCVQADAIIREMVSKEIGLSGSSKTSDASAQLRALGFVA